MIIAGKTKCKYCIFFRYLAESMEGIKEDGWCILHRKFKNSTDGNCADFTPRLRSGW
jgi:hypothetical protein